MYKILVFIYLHSRVGRVWSGPTPTVRTISTPGKPSERTRNISNRTATVPYM